MYTYILYSVEKIVAAAAVDSLPFLSKETKAAAKKKRKKRRDIEDTQKRHKSHDVNPQENIYYLLKT